LRNVSQLIAIVRDDCDTRLPDVARQVLKVLARQICLHHFHPHLFGDHQSRKPSQTLSGIHNTRLKRSDGRRSVHISARNSARLLAAAVDDALKLFDKRQSPSA
jgi:hypothetical protein